ncbi:MAG: flagellar basal body rod protein FlgB [Gallionella sp.]
MNKLDGMLRFQQTALNLRAARQELLASNIANADTPGYKARDIDFASALKNAMGGSVGSLPMKVTSAKHLAGVAGGAIMGSPVLYRKPVQPSADGNTVDMDVERVQFADNALRYDVSVKFVSGALKGLMKAILGR